MITITILKNPFNYSEKEVYTCEPIPGKTAYQYIQPYIMGLEDYIVNINGNVVEDAKVQLVNSDDWLAICPVVGKSGSDWFRAIFTIALGMWVNGGVTNFFAKTLKFDSFWANVAAGAVGMVGGNLISHWFPPAKADEVQTKSSYNWGNAQSQTGQGNALAVTYGTMRTAGQVLAQHVSSDDEDQYLNILLCGGEGPIDSISDIRINDNPISYYKDVTVETRLGVNDQAVIANFNDIYDDQPLAYELNTDNTWATQQTEGNAVEGLEVTLQFPGGLYYANDNSSLGNASVTINMQYRKVGDTSWNDFSNPTITAAKNTAFFRTYRLDNLTPAQYEVRAQCTAKSGTSTRYSTHVYWTQLSSIMYDDFARPGKVLIGIKALATSQLSGGMPSITWIQTRDKVWVWNAETSTYEQKSATNPAWAAYDMIHRCRQIKNINTGNYEFIIQGAPASRAVYQDFVSWAAFCDDRNLTFNYIFDTANDLWTLLQKPEGVGRGKVIMRGTKFGSVCDAPSDPVQLFTVGNILADKFKETFVSLKDRANAIEISFPNKDKAYEKEVITVYADNYDDSTEPNITQITLDGVTTVEQAYREAKYRLRLNQYLMRTVEHSADIDAIACQINDVVLLAHDVPQWGISGRLLAATTTTVQLDREVTLEPCKSYAMAIQSTNLAATTSQDVQSIVTVAVQGVTEVTTTDSITLNSELSTVPLKWDLYSFGETSKVVKPFRVLNISRDQDLKRKITCLEYIEEVYTEATAIPEINYSELDTLLEVNSVSVAEETYCQKDGTMVSDINIAWSIPRTATAIRGYNVLYSADNGTTWIPWSSGIKALSTSVVGVKTETTYLVKVCTINDLGLVSDGMQASLYITGKDFPPSDVALVSAAIDVTDSTKINLSWSAVDDIDLKGYNLMEGNTVLTPTPIADTRYTYTATSSRQYIFSIVAIDNSGNPSNIPAMKTVNVAIEPAQVAGFSVTQKDADRSRAVLSWAANAETDISYYEIRQGATWNTGIIIATQLKATTYEYILTSEGNYNFMIKAVNISGNYSLSPTVITQSIVLRPHAPATGTITPNLQDTTTLVLSWSPVTDADLSTYEIRQGTNWATGTLVMSTKESTYRYKCSASGSYSFMVASKNIAGYYSTPLNLTCQSNIEPLAVTGFTATQTIVDRTKVRLQWSQPSALDVAYYEIRQGISWPTATVIGQRITGTFFDYVLPGNGSETFWICAVNVGGIYSKTPASVTGIYNLAPDVISNLQITQNPNDRSELIVSWTGVSESDLLEYDVCLGSVWGVPCVTTKETSLVYPINASGNYTFRVKSKNTGGYYSSEVFASGTFQVEPMDVTGLTAMQNGKNVMLFWSKSTGNDVVSYEIHQGNSYDNGSIVASGVTLTNYSVPVDTNKLYQYYVKAINRSGHFSTNAASVAITVSNLPPINVIASYDEIALHSGTHSNTTFGVSTFTFATVGGKFSDYPTTKFSDIGGASVLKLALNGSAYYSSGTYACQRINVGTVITANISTVFQPSVLLQSGVAATLQFRYSQNGTTFTSWQNFVPVQATFQYLDFQVLLSTANTAISPEVNQFTIRIDVPDKPTYGNATIAVGGTTVPYGYTYYNQAHPLPTAIGAGLSAQIISIGLSSFVCKVVNSAETDVGGTISWNNNGY